MRNNLKYVFIVILFSGLLNATTISNEAKGAAEAPLFNLLKTTQWDLFMTEFEISMDIGFCGEGSELAIGLKARSIEPIGYFETTKKRLYFPFADFDIDESGGVKSSTDSFDGSGASSTAASGFSKIMMFGSPRTTEDDDSNEGGRDNVVWSHFVYAPIFGMLFKKKMKFLCLSSGDIQIPILSEFLPGYTKDIVFVNMIPQMLMMFSPQGLLTSILDCGASTGVNALHGFVSGENDIAGSGLTDFIDSNNGYDPGNQDNDSNRNDLDESNQDTEDYLNSLRNTMFWTAGCLGFAPVGGYISGDDPGADNELIGYGLLNLLHGASSILPKPFLSKQSNFSLLGGGSETPDGEILSSKDTMCQPEAYPMIIQSQYLVQRAGIPTTGRAHCMGATPAVTTTAANTPQSGDNWVNMIWQYRDYYAFAYFCPK